MSDRLSLAVHVSKTTEKKQLTLVQYRQPACYTTLAQQHRQNYYGY